MNWVYFDHAIYISRYFIEFTHLIAIFNISCYILMMPYRADNMRSITPSM